MLAKGRLAALKPTPLIIDLTHGIEPGDLRQAAYVLGEVMHEFPPSTVHMAGIGNSPEVIATKIGEQIVISPNHELISMIPGFKGKVRYLSMDAREWHPLQGKLPLALEKLWDLELDLEKWGENFDSYETKDMPLAVIGEKELKGIVIHVDGAGNIFTNIKRGDVERLSQGNPYRIILSRHEWVDEISSKMHDGRNGAITCSFSSGNHLVIAVNSGNAKQLLGLNKGSIISIEKL